MSDPRSPATAGLWGGAGLDKKRWVGWFAVSAGLLATGLLLTFPLDFPAYRFLERHDRVIFGQVAQGLSFWGDYFPGSILVSVVLFAGGWMAKSRRVRSAALASFLAATVAGVTVDAVRFSVGRPRPYATAAAATLQLGRKPPLHLSFRRTRPDNDLADGFYGPLGVHMFQGFPSGHATSSVASATAVLPLVPEVGLPLSLLAAGVCWSRMELRQHYLSDITVGALWGGIWGLSFGTLLLRRLRNRRSPLGTKEREGGFERRARERRHME